MLKCRLLLSVRRSPKRQRIAYGAQRFYISALKMYNFTVNNALPDTDRLEIPN